MGLVSGLPSQLFALPLVAAGDPFRVPGLILLVVGAALFVWGCWAQAKGKGYGGALGLIGFLGVLGLIILAVLPDRHADRV
jgi:hypothetical protein